MMTNVIPRFFMKHNVHRVSKNVQPLACYNFDIHERIFDICR